MKKLPGPWKFIWKDNDSPKVIAANGCLVAMLSTGTIDGPRDPKDICALGNLIASVPDIIDISHKLDSVLAKLISDIT